MQIKGIMGMQKPMQVSFGAFEKDSNTIPLEVLEAELPRNMEQIHGIHPKKMEDLVVSILSGIYDCEVHQLGYTKDGGIDLILLNGDSPITVQVKRRGQARTEGVQGVREFLGAALLSGYDDLVYVTSAVKFLNASKKAASASVEKNLVNSCSLISLNKFSELLKEIASDRNWIYALRDAKNRKDIMPNIPNPYTDLLNSTV